MCGEASRPLSLCVCGERPQRDGLSDDRNDDVLEAPPTRVAERAPEDTPEPAQRNAVLWSTTRVTGKVALRSKERLNNFCSAKAQKIYE